MSILFPMNVIEETRHAHQIIYIRFCYHRSVDTSDGGLLVPDDITHSVASVSALTWFIRSICH
jgi:hypothetical protein